MHMAVGDDEKPKFRCLDAGRYAVAFTVSVILVVVIVHAVATVLRPANLIVRLDRGYVSVKNMSSSSKVPPHELSFTFTFWAINTSGRVRIYFTDIMTNFSRSLTVEDFFVCKVEGLFVGPQEAKIVSPIAPSNAMLSADFNQLFGGGSINAILKLSGIRTVEIYEGHNDTAKPVVYYCSPITVGGENPEDGAPDVRCTEQQPS